MEKVDPTVKEEKLPSGVACIDYVMSGGLEPGVMTELYGEGGTGKSNMCMVFAVSALSLGRSVIFLDTEGLSTERLLQVSGGDTGLLRHLMLYRITSLDDQEVAIMRSSKMMERERKVGLLIIDSFTEYFRLEKSSDTRERVAAMQRHISLLNSIAVRFRVPVLLTNQIYLDPEEQRLEPFGGYVIDHSMKAIFMLEKSDGVRRIVTVKHRSVEEGRSAQFRITESGISCEV
ncbi:DNA repair and recombination protein RadB [Thermogymnomonas acidicola]|nr:DNA repair and recombination protein RadB [Thermogymnomonas acidicola]